jgi:hypothetical protein
LIVEKNSKGIALFDFGTRNTGFEQPKYFRRSAKQVWKGWNLNREQIQWLPNEKSPSVLPISCNDCVNGATIKLVSCRSDDRMRHDRFTADARPIYLPGIDGAINVAPVIPDSSWRLIEWPHVMAIVFGSRK